VVVDKQTESVEICEVRSFSIVALFDGTHPLLVAKDIVDGVVHWVVKECSDSSLILSNIAWITVEALTHLEDSSSLSKLSPEIFGHFWNCVDSNSIKSVSLNKV
jgi:hypothetical protein